MTRNRPGPDVDLASLYRSHATALLRLAVVLTGDRPLAEELVQEAFVRFHRSGASPLPGAELAYLRRTVINLSHGHHRHLAVVRRRSVERAGDVEAAEHEAVRRDAQRRVAAAVRSLPSRQRDCVVLHYYDGLSDADVADTLGISAGSVKTHLHRARAALAEQLETLR
ncbi:MAG: RNA polymerase sigma factor [Acidimicrobiales bacterium]